MNRLLIVGIIATIALVTMGPTINQTVQSVVGPIIAIPVKDARDAPIATSGDNIYIVWWTNRTGNDEVQFRASTDGGTTFADKINLSNTTDAESQDVEIAAEGDNVVVTWWERNATANEPVAKISTDNGGTFGPLLKLATNGTIGTSGEAGG